MSYEDLFRPKLGTYKNEKNHLEIKNCARPIFHKLHVPFAVRGKVKAELVRLENEGIIEKVSHSNWGTPLIPVLKSNFKDIRVCANYKISINKYLKDFNHPLPLIDDIFAALSSGKKFTKLDFLNAYNQLEVDPETSDLLAWSTPYGIYMVNRLPFGTKPACSLFQSIVEKVLLGCSGCVTYMDDVVVTGSNDEEHLKT